MGLHNAMEMCCGNRTHLASYDYTTLCLIYTAYHLMIVLSRGIGRIQRLSPWTVPLYVTYGLMLQGGGALLLLLLLLLPESSSGSSLQKQHIKSNLCTARPVRIRVRSLIGACISTHCQRSDCA
jgi:hypothetical protein